MLVISVVIFINYIWPEIGSFREVRKKNEENKNLLQSIEQKKNNIRKINEGLTAESEKENFVKKYFPKNRQEENIIDQINYLAKSSNVVLLDFNIGDSVSKINGASALDEDEFLSQNGIKGKATESVAKKSVSSKIIAIGSYADVKVFIEKIMKMELLNNIETINMKPSQAENNEGEEQDVELDIITAEINNSFYYLNEIKSSRRYADKVFDQENLDFSKVEKAKQFVSSGLSALKIDDGEAGRNNPFISL